MTEKDDDAEVGGEQICTILQHVAHCIWAGSLPDRWIKEWVRKAIKGHLPDSTWTVIDEDD